MSSPAVASQTPEPEGKPRPDLQLIGDVVEREHASQIREIAELDTKAGLLLGLSGVVVSLQKASLVGLQVLGVRVAAVACFLALFSLFVRPSYSIDPEKLRQRYAGQERVSIMERIVDTRCDLYRRAARLLSVKNSFFILAAIALAVSVLFTVIGISTKP